MKIRITRNKKIIRVYHQPRDVIVHPKARTVDVLREDGTLLEQFDLIERNLVWSDDEDTDCSEILLEIEVK